MRAKKREEWNRRPFKAFGQMRRDHALWISACGKWMNRSVARPEIPPPPDSAWEPCTSYEYEWEPYALSPRTD